MRGLFLLKLSKTRKERNRCIGGVVRLKERNTRKEQKSNEVTKGAEACLI